VLPSGVSNVERLSKVSMLPTRSARRLCGAGRGGAERSEAAHGETKGFRGTTSALVMLGK
jgi:hypothetical protein